MVMASSPVAGVQADPGPAEEPVKESLYVVSGFSWTRGKVPERRSAYRRTPQRFFHRL